jgi:hypothetical protein
MYFKLSIGWIHLSVYYKSPKRGVNAIHLSVYYKSQKGGVSGIHPSVYYKSQKSGVSGIHLLVICCLPHLLVEERPGIYSKLKGSTFLGFIINWQVNPTDSTFLGFIINWQVNRTDPTYHSLTYFRMMNTKYIAQSGCMTGFILYMYLFI